MNFLFDRTQRPHLTGDDVSDLTGVPKSTLANKAKLIRDVLRIGQMEPELCRRELFASNPMAWMISVDGLFVDARTMPPEVQAEARRRELIPDLPAGHAGVNEVSESEASMKGLAEAVRDVIDILPSQPASRSDRPDGWDAPFESSRSRSSQLISPRDLCNTVVGGSIRSSLASS